MTMIQAIETVDTRGNITRHAARGDADDYWWVRCGRPGTVGRNHPEATIPSTLRDIQCGRCVRLVEHDRRKLAVRQPFKRKWLRQII